MQQEHVRGVEVIIRRLLDVAAIGVNLAFHLLAHHARAKLFPRAALRKSSEEQPQRVQRQRLAQQMRVRRKVERKIILQMAAVLIELAQPFHAELRDHLLARQVIDPDPRQRPKRHFQRADPVDSAMIRIRREPAFELRANLAAGCAGSPVNRTPAPESPDADADSAPRSLCDRRSAGHRDTESGGNKRRPVSTPLA